MNISFGQCVYWTTNSGLKKLTLGKRLESLDLRLARPIIFQNNILKNYSVQLSGGGVNLSHSATDFKWRY